MHSDHNSLTRSQLSKKSGVGLEAIRFYEKKELLRPAFRDSSNYRRYHEDAVDQLRFISNAKDLGFTLSEIKELQEIRGLSDSPCERMQAQARSKLAQVDAKIRKLRRIRSTLSALLKDCEQSKSATNCPILAGIES